MQEVINVIIWYGVVWVVGMAVLPTVGIIWKNSFDGGYGVARIAGLAIVGYLTLVLGTLRIVPFGSAGLWAVLLVLGIVSWTRKVEWKKWMLVEELIFMTVFGIFVYLRGINPDIIWGGSEKMMDFMLIKSVLNTRYFPPADRWMAGLTTNYYYFGHLVWASLIKMTGVLPEIGYNLAVATLAASAAIGIFGVAGNLIWLSGIKNKKLILAGGLVSTLMLLGGGNLQTIYALAKNGVKSYNYWDGIRVIPGTINEFPTYSFLVGDLHSHVNNLPFVLLGLGLITLVYMSKGYQIRFAIIQGFLLAIYYMTSAPDAYIYAGLFVLVIGMKAVTEEWKVGETLTYIFAMLATGAMLSMPFAIYFRPFGQGLGIVSERSPVFLLFLLWGWIAYVFSGLGVIKKKGMVGIWLAACILFVIIPEMIYMKDIYGGDFKRANTMFKFGYQVSILGGAAAGYVLAVVWNHKKTWIKSLWMAGFGLGMVSVMIYPYFMAKALYGERGRSWNLNGLSFLKSLSAEDYGAIRWIEANSPENAVVVEAVGESYTASGRISAYSGRATILGWPVHEWLWRGSNDTVSLRLDEVRRIYESENDNEVRKLLGKYGVGFIVIGDLERLKYPNMDEEKWNAVGGEVFRSGRTAIFQVSR